jgi:hypothetical protein
VKKGYTLVAVLMDRSGSMDSIRTETEKGIRDIVSEVAKATSFPNSVDFTLAQFDTEYELVQKRRTASEFSFSLYPRGGTALYDSIVQIVTDVRQIINDLPESEKPEHVQIVVATDGEENRSKTADAMLVSDTVEYHTRNLGWDFVYVGANQDAVYAGKLMGFEGKKSMTFSATASGVAGVASSLSDYIQQTQSGQDASFSDEHRARSI